MQLDNKFRFSYDPFGLVDFNSKNGRYVPKPPKSNWGWVLWIILLLILGLGILFRETIYKFFFPTTDDVDDKSEKIEPNEEVSEQLPAVTAQVYKLQPEHKVIMRLDLADEAKWDLELLEAKKKEGKAEFVKGKGWLLYK
jgi:flagellar basal body-associated protein FliL